MTDQMTMSQIQSALEGLSNERLGKILKEYVRESNHVSWDGFSSRDMTGVKRFLRDFLLYELGARNG